MIRVLVREVFMVPAGDYPTQVEHKTFVVEDATLERYLREKLPYNNRSVIGAELIEESDKKETL